MLPRRAHHNRNARFVIKIPDSAVRTESRTVSCVVQPHKHRLNLQTAESCKGSGHLLHFAITGFGDRILDTIGLSLLGQHGAFERLTHVFCDLESRAYDPSLFAFPDEKVRITREQDVKAVGSKRTDIQPGSSLHPLKIQRFLISQGIMGASLADLEEAFKARAAHLRPCVDIQRLIPDEIAECNGVHLRKSDKIDVEDNEYHGTTSDDLRHIVAALKSEVSSLITRGQSRFFVCSEDMAWKREFEDWLLGAGGVSIRLGAADAVASSRAGFDAVLDFFALSQCKRILQGIGYSTFSMAASLVHDVPLTNFCRKRSTQPSYFLNWWLPLLKEGGIVPQGHRQACDRVILDICVQT